MTELAAHAIEGPPSRAPAVTAGLSVPAGYPYSDPRFPPPAPAVHNGAWIDYATGEVHPWWEGWHSTSAGASSPATWLWIAVEP